MKCQIHRRGGFSLLEMLAVVTIIGVLAAMIVPRIAISGAEAKKKMCTHRISEVNKGLERYFIEKGERATSVDQLTELDTFPDGVPSCPLTGDSYKIDSNGRVATCRCTSL